MMKQYEGTGLMINGGVAHNRGFVSATQEQVTQALAARLARCDAGVNSTRPEVFRPIDMLFKEEDFAIPLYHTFHQFEYGKNREGYWNSEKMVRGLRVAS